MNYWQECVECALDEAGVEATPEQIAIIVGAVESGHDNYGMAHGYDCIPNPLVLEIEKLSKSLKFEREKVVCPECKGKRTITSYGPYHSATSSCDVCNGDGKVHPRNIRYKG